jgi:hypothetical protein
LHSQFEPRIIFTLFFSTLLVLSQIEYLLSFKKVKVRNKNFIIQADNLWQDQGIQKEDDRRFFCNFNILKNFGATGMVFALLKAIDFRIKEKQDEFQYSGCDIEVTDKIKRFYAD